MFLSFMALAFGVGEVAVAPQAKAERPAFDVSVHLKAQLAARSRMDEVQLAAAPVVEPGLFSFYKDFEVSAALVNRALSREYWVSQGAHFDPVHNHQLEQSVTEPFLRDRGITEVLSVGVSDYAGSRPNRLQNMQTTIDRFDGYIVKRGETFSFNQILGEVTEEAGFTWARVLKNGQNAWGLGGGVCQISTNLFRAALNAGLTINDRRAHSLDFDKYAPTGLDATIYLGQQDLVFTNNTPGDILMKFVRRDEKLVTVFYGTRDTRQVALKKTKHWEGFDGRIATHWTRTVNYRDSVDEAIFVSYYRAASE